MFISSLPFPSPLRSVMQWINEAFQIQRMQVQPSNCCSQLMWDLGRQCIWNFLKLVLKTHATSGNTPPTLTFRLSLHIYTLSLSFPERSDAVKNKISCLVSKRCLLPSSTLSQSPSLYLFRRLLFLEAATIFVKLLRWQGLGDSWRWHHPVNNKPLSSCHYIAGLRVHERAFYSQDLQSLLPHHKINPSWKGDKPRKLTLASSVGGVAVSGRLPTSL